MAFMLGRASLYSVSPQRAISLIERTLQEPMAVSMRGELRLFLAGLLCHAGDGSHWPEQMRRAAEELRQRPERAMPRLPKGILRMLGDAPIGGLAQRHLADYARIVMQINQVVPDVVLNELQDDGENVKASAAETIRQQLNEVWRSQSPVVH